MDGELVHAVLLCLTLSMLIALSLAGAERTVIIKIVEPFGEVHTLPPLLSPQPPKSPQYHSPSPRPPTSPPYQSPPQMALRLSDRVPGSFDVLVDGRPWLEAGRPHAVWAEGEEHIAGSQRLRLAAEQPMQTFGSDVLGAYDRRSWRWHVGGGGRVYETAVRSYASSSMLIFEQHFVSALNVTAARRGGLASSFPSFRLPQAHRTGNDRLHFLAYDGDMAGQLYKHGEWHAGARGIGSGLAGSAPLVVFDAALRHAVVLSAFSNFMVASQQYRDGHLAYGVLGSVRTIPAGFRLETVAVSAAGGIRRAMLRWGDVLLRRYGKRRAAAWERDVTLTTLGYGTQNGAYYYYNAPKGKSFEDVLLRVASDGRAKSVPYKWWLADSWWYHKHAGQLPRGVSRPGVTRWEPLREGIFPHGLGIIRNATGWAMLGHNRYWSAHTPYARQNGGKFAFELDYASGMALPLEGAFWRALFAHGRERGWGLVGYEQDWMDVQTERLPALTTSATLGRTWLRQMGAGAAEANVSIQYCMSWARHILASVEVAAVTQARGSGDYRAGNQLWARLGRTGLLLYALGLGASKDTFWTTRSQPGNRWGDRTVEPHARLQAAVATLSRGPVAPSDAIGRSDPRLIMRSCDARGRLLQPGEPAVAIDRAILAAAQGRPLGEVWFGATVVSGRRYGSLLGALVPRPLTLTPADLGYGDTVAPSVLVAVDSTCDTTAAGGMQSCRVVAGVPLVGRCGADDFALWTLAPLEAEGEWTLLGELDKWVGVSNARFASIGVERGIGHGTSALVVLLRGKPGERVALALLPPYSQDTAAASPRPRQTELQPLVVVCRVSIAAEVRLRCASRRRDQGACRCQSDVGGEP